MFENLVELVLWLLGITALVVACLAVWLWFSEGLEDDDNDKGDGFW